MRPSSPEKEAPLQREVRWFVSLRWLAGVAVAGAAAATALGAGWTDRHQLALAIGLCILAYNLVLWLRIRQLGREPAPHSRVAQIAWAQILLDLACLTALVLLTGGLGGPLPALFLGHMVFASLLLGPLAAYLTAATAMAMLFGGLFATGNWPIQRDASLLALGWCMALLLTVYIANHITATLRRHQTALRRQDRRTAAILETAADAILTFDETGRIESANPAAERLFGLDKDALPGVPIDTCIPGMTRTSTANDEPPLLRQLQGDASSFSREVRGRRANGSEFPIELGLCSLGLGVPRLFTAIVRDVTERVRTEAELRQLNDDLKRQQQALIQQERLATMGQMAAGVAHEISNPLANMQSVLQLIRRRPDRLDEQTVDTLGEQIERIRRTIHEMTYFAHPHDSCWECVRLSELVEQTLSIIRFDQRMQGIEVIREFGRDDAMVRVMPHALQQVLVNLIVNALDSLLDVADARLTIRTDCDENWHRIEVSDNGQGIALDHLGRVFEPFFTTKPAGKGTGLGLSISSALVARHGGRLEVKSIVGRGASFRILLPISGESSCDREPAASPIPDHEKSDP